MSVKMACLQHSIVFHSSMIDRSHWSSWSEFMIGTLYQLYEQAIHSLPSATHQRFKSHNLREMKNYRHCGLDVQHIRSFPCLCHSLTCVWVLPTQSVLVPALLCFLYTIMQNTALFRNKVILVHPYTSFVWIMISDGLAVLLVVRSFEVHNNRDFVFWWNPGLVNIPDVLVLDVVMINYAKFILEEAARLINRKRLISLIRILIPDRLKATLLE